MFEEERNLNFLVSGVAIRSPIRDPSRAVRERFVFFLVRSSLMVRCVVSLCLQVGSSELVHITESLTMIHNGRVTNRGLNSNSHLEDDAAHKITHKVQPKAYEKLFAELAKLRKV